MTTALPDNLQQILDTMDTQREKLDRLRKLKEDPRKSQQPISHEERRKGDRRGGKR
jgi:Spy/CpxP family protein refolding chaperone